MFYYASTRAYGAARLARRWHHPRVLAANSLRDRYGHALGPVPCKRNLSHGHSGVFGYFKHTFDDGHVLVLRLIILVAHDAVSGAAGGIRISCRAFMVPAGDPDAMGNEWLEPVAAQAYESLA